MGVRRAAFEPPSEPIFKVPSQTSLIPVLWDSAGV